MSKGDRLLPTKIVCQEEEVHSEKRSFDDWAAIKRIKTDICSVTDNDTGGGEKLVVVNQRKLRLKGKTIFLSYRLEDVVESGNSDGGGMNNGLPGTGVGEVNNTPR